MLRKILPFVLITFIGFPVYGQDNNDGWISLFNGKDLTGWKASENEGTFTVRNGMIIVNGKRSHLFYDGPVENANFQDFEFKADIMTKPGANSEPLISWTNVDTRRLKSLMGMNNSTLMAIAI